MASRTRATTGYTIAQVMRMPVSQLTSYTPSIQREFVSRLASASNKRLKQFEKQGIKSPATRRLMESGGKISVKGKSGEDLIKEFNRAKNFLLNRFSSIQEYKKVMKQLSEKIEVDVNVTSRVFNLYDQLKDYVDVSEENKYEIMDEIAELIEDTNMSDNEILDYVISSLNKAEQDIRNKLQEDELNPFKIMKR